MSNARELIVASHALAAQQRERMEELLNHIRRNMESITESFFEIGQALTEILNNRLHLAAGYRSLDEMLEKNRLVSPQYARRLSAVATTVPRDTAVLLGPDKAYLLVRYLQASQAATVQTATRDRALLSGKKLHELSRGDFLTAIERAQRRHGTARPSRKLPGQAVARDAEKSLRKAGIRNPVIKTGRRGGAVVYRLELDEAALMRLMRSL